MLIYLLAILGLIWLAGAWIRVYQQARFFQIEEYMSLRYLRWLFGQRDRWLPTRGTVAGLGGVLVGLFVGDTLIVTGGLLMVAALIAAYPAETAEVKKGFKRTPRAMRMLITAFVVAALLVIGAGWVTVSIPDAELALVSLSALGFVVWALSPLVLVIGRLLMEPVEASIRQGFKRQARRKLDDIQPTVIGITGSYGKTSTKTYIAHILNGKYRAFPTPKSWNTIMGVCLAINTRLEAGTEYFICEMGAYVRGEIQGISKLTRPTISIVTEVGPQHLERFGSLENIAIAKYEIIKALPSDGVGVFNWDNPYIRDMIAKGYPQTRLTVSRTVSLDDMPENGPRFVASDIDESLDGLRFTVTDVDTGKTASFETSLLGMHTVTNILIATAVAIHAGMTLDEVARRVRTLEPAESRLVRNVLPNGMTIINDAYSANPVGAVSSLNVLKMHDTGRRLLITPGMVELGDLHDEENYKLGQAAADAATDVILVGEQQTRPIYKGLLAANFPTEQIQIVESVNDAIAWYQAHLGQGDTVLFLNDLPDTY